MVYFIRHGLDDETFIGGWSDVDLIEEGINQVNKSINFIKKNLDIKKIYSSDIKRAITTSNMISKELNIPVIKTDIFREQNKGLVNGLIKEDAIINYGLYLNSKDINLRYPKGESLLDLYNRITSNYDEIKSLENSLIVTHRGVINMLYYYLNNDKLDLNKKKYNVDHASIHELDINKGIIRRIF